MSLDPATIQRIARLARIHVPQADVPRLQADLNGILGWIEMLNEVDVTGITPLSSGATIALRLREDAVTDGGIPDAILANAPEKSGRFFTVPKVAE